MVSTKALDEIFHRVKSKYQTVVVDAFIVSKDWKSILMQKRSMERKLFPGFWDAFGGHLEGSEDLRQALAREIKEESQMELTEILEFVHEFEWQDDRSVVNLQFLCLAKGEAKYEENLVTEIRWLSKSDLNDLASSLTGQMREGITRAFAYLKTD